MKSRKLILLEKILRFMAKAVLAKYKPRIVAITGSVGKTTTKEMVFVVLKKFFPVRKNEKNYNNEVGVPLTIIGAVSGEHSIAKWAGVFFKWLWIMIFPTRYPKVLVLEMGADRQGDIKYLCGFVPVDVGILTNVGISHLEYFKSKKEVAREKSNILRSLSSGGLAVYNQDDEECRKIAEKLKSNAIGYGFAKDAKMRASDVIYNYQELANHSNRDIQLLKGVAFKLNYQGKIIPVRMTHCIAKPQIYSALAALSAVVYFDLNILDAVKAIEEFLPAPGRMGLLDGIKNTVIIDDSYNSAPDSLRAALDCVSNIKALRKFAALGDMLELGGESEQAHANAGKMAAESGIDFFVSVGKRMALGAKEFAKAKADPQSAVQFDSPKDAGLFLQGITKEGDLVLVKGSQGVRMEKIVEEIMAHPNEKSKLLVRQDKKWLEKPYVQP
jgi:UDP-N-acetylmuramoyl-tripeptide--D-alanyl-D-alanine ligase